MAWLVSVCVDLVAYLTVSTVFVYAVPWTPVPNVCAEYDNMTGTLLTIESTWNEVVCGEQSHTLYFGCKFVCVAHEITMKSSLTSSVHYYVIDLL